MDTKSAKRIHITHFYYQLKKSRIRILVEDLGNNLYCLPHNYLTTNDKFDFKDNKHYAIYDCQDIEVEDCEFKEIHTKKKNRMWVDLKDITKYAFEKNETYDIYYKIFYILFDRTRYSGDNPFVQYRAYLDFEFYKIREAYMKIFDDILRERCRLRYIANINRYLVEPNNGMVVFDAIWHPMDDNLLEKELKTLEHFKMERVKITNGPYEYDYAYEEVPYEVFGGEIEPMKFYGPASLLIDFSIKH